MILKKRALITTKKNKPLPKINETTQPKTNKPKGERFKRIAKKVATVARIPGIVVLTTVATGFGIKQTIDFQSKRIFKESMTKNLAEHTITNKTYLDEIAAYNKKSKISEVYFLNTVEKTPIRVNLNLATFEQVSNLLPRQQRENIDRIILNRIRIGEAEISRNPKLRKKIIDRVGIPSYEKYLLSLPMAKIQNIFTTRELELIKEQMNNIPKEKLKEIKNQLDKSSENAIGYGAIAGILTGALLLEIKKKKKIEEFNFH